MRKMTANEVDQETEAILKRPWPLGRTLPMKNLYDGRLGTISVDDEDLVVPDVSVTQTGETAEYQSVREMVEAGWVGD